MTDKKENKKCIACKRTNGIVVYQDSGGSKVWWCANCYTDYLRRTSNKRRVRYVSQPQF